MVIQILPAQLANQIAAGEVVERPASIIKELVENSIDAGASRIDIEIEQGGCKLIRIRDNGCGIAKDELSLALARHATSKISSLDDLEAIISLGFRGEALASISSVSRLTLTSKPAEQSEAWQVYAEGRDMSPVIKPASHPIGSTVEVLDIFYNTPARRRFLKTEKTEFAHIDEIVRRIALAYPNIAFNLQHNGKLIRQYRIAESEQQIEKRIATICGVSFMQKAIKLMWQHDDLLIKGWVAANALQEQLQYFYVNGRVVKDRLLNHALKQAFLERNKSSVYSTDDTLSYVIYLELNPHQVDVNVHPAKHEVRFHEARLVHDFVYQAMVMALSSQKSSQNNSTVDLLKDHNDGQSGYEIKQNRAAAGHNIFTSSALNSTDDNKRDTEHSHHQPMLHAKKITHADTNHVYSQLVKPIANHQELNEELVSVQQKAVIESLFPKRNEPLVKYDVALSSAVTLGRVLTIVDNQYLLLEKYDNQRQILSLLSLKQMQLIIFKRKIAENNSEQHQERLLIPLSILLNKQEQQLINSVKSLLEALNFEFIIDKSKLQLNAVPKLMRKANWQSLLPKLISFISNNASDLELKTLIGRWLAKQYLEMDNQPVIIWSMPQAISLLTELEQLNISDSELSHINKPIDLSDIIKNFKSE